MYHLYGSAVIEILFLWKKHEIMDYIMGDESKFAVSREQIAPHS